MPQMKYANKIKAKFSMVLGDDEIESGKAKLKNMLTGTEKEVPLNEDFYDRFFAIYVNGANDTFMEKLGLSVED